MTLLTTRRSLLKLHQAHMKVRAASVHIKNFVPLALHQFMLKAQSSKFPLPVPSLPASSSTALVGSA